MKSKIMTYILVCIFCFGLVFSLSGVSMAMGGDYAASTLITGVSFDSANVRTGSSDSDCWPTTWANDDNLYVAWGDGKGFSGTSDVSYGIAKVSGTLSTWTGTNVFYGPVGRNLGKVTSLLAANNTYLYAILNTQSNGVKKLMTSANNGTSWTTSSWSWAGTTGSFSPSYFLQYGKNYAGAPDSYVYVYGGKIGSAGTYMARAPLASIGTQSSWEYLTGIDASNNASWGAMTSMVSAFPAGAAVFYDSGLGRYLCTDGQWYGDENEGGTLGIYEGVKPWGPWYEAYASTTWQGLTGGTMTCLSFPSKWMSTDGKSLGLVFSPWGTNNANWNDHMCTIPVTLTTASTGGWTEDFNDGAANGWAVQTGTWNITSSRYVSSALGAADISVYNSASYTNCTFSADTQGNDAGIVIHYKDANNYYYMRTKVDGSLELKKVLNGAATVIYTAATGVTDAQHNLKLSISGNTITCYLDGVSKGSYTDSTNPITSGKVGVRSSSTSATKWFDNCVLQ